MRVFKIFLLICGLFPAVCSVQAVQSGSVYAWGINDYNQLEIPDPNSDFISIAAGNLHSLGLKKDYSIAAWGRNYESQCNVPQPNSDFIAIAAGYNHSLGLRQDGSIAAWGYNGYGQCNVPQPNSDFIAIAAGFNYSLGLKKDGSIAAWGYNNDGQCNVPQPNSDFIAITAGSSHNLGLKKDNSIAAWGQNDYGQCNVPQPNSDFIAIAAGNSHSLGLKKDNSIAAWGRNYEDQCNVPEPNSDFIAIAAGLFHSLGLRQDGSIAAWGYNSHGQCNVPKPNSDFIAIAAGGYHSLAIKGIQHSYFQYQGLLVEQGVPAYGSYDLEFLLYDTPNDVNLAAFPVTVEDVNVIDGHYTVELDFGSGVFDGKPCWLEILSRPAGSEDAFDTNGKREKLSPAPYALYAYNGVTVTGQANNQSRNSLDAEGGSPTEAVYVDNTGKVGIGTTSPSETLDIFGTVKMTGFKLPGGAFDGYVLTSDGSGVGTWKALPATSSSSGFTGSGSPNYFPKFTSSTSLGNSVLFESPGGNIGIGTTSPGTKLEVQGGAIKATGGLIIETRTSDPSNPVTGQIWLRTDL